MKKRYSPNNKHSIFAFMVLMWLTGFAHGELQLRAGGALVYDTDLNITWFADANVTQTSGADTDGLMAWDEAMSWVNNLEYGGATDWRLPGPLPGTGPDQSGCTADCLDNEMAYLYSVYLGGAASGPLFDLTGDQGPFTDIRAQYWTHIEWDNDPLDWAWNFHFENGVQFWHVKTDMHAVWPVRDGDIALLPRITGIWPGSANPGDTISLFVFGEHFDSAQTRLSINGIEQFLLAVVSPDMLIARITADSTLFGPVNVSTPHGTAISSTQFGMPPRGLQITGVWPAQVSVGDFVFVFGSDFQSASTQVAVNSVNAALVQVVSNSMLIFMLPVSATTGLVSVTTPATTAISASDLVVVP